MDQQKIDRLFREKLDGYESAPSTDAWAQVEAQIGTGKKPIVLYWVAAAVSILAISWVVWPREAPIDSTPIASEVNHPLRREAPQFTVPLVAVESPKKQKSTPTNNIQHSTQLVAQELNSTTPDKKVEEASMPLIEMDTKEVVAVAELERPEIQELPTNMEPESVIEEPLKFDLSKVKITYIASEAKAEKTQEADSVGGIKKLFAIAGKISPGDVLADIRTAKDDFISSGFKAKDKDRASL